MKNIHKVKNMGSIHLFNPSHLFFFNFYYVPGTNLTIENTAINKTYIHILKG